MLSYDPERLVPLCPECSKELEELQVTITNTRYFAFDCKTRQYKLTSRTKAEDDNHFHCPECGAGIKSKDIFETVVFLNELSKKELVPAG